MAFNFTGTPNTSDYNLGRGIVYFSGINATTGKPSGGFRDLGNSPEFNITIDKETLEHLSSQEGLKSTDKEVVVSQKVNFNLTLDEISIQNMGIFFSGAGNISSQRGGANVGAAIFTDVNASSQGAPFTGGNLAGSLEGIDGGVLPGRWYGIVDSEGKRVFGLKTVYLETGALVPVAATIGDDQAHTAGSLALAVAPDVTTGLTNLDTINGISNCMVEGTHYDLDYESGMIFFREFYGETTLTQAQINAIATEANWANNIDLDVKLGTGALAGTGSASQGYIPGVTALTQSSTSGVLKFVGVNPAASDAKTEYLFHQVSLKAEGDYSLISDDWTTLTLSGVAEKNELAQANSPTLTIRGLEVHATNLA